MNPIVLRIILALAPSIEKLLLALLERWLEDRHKQRLQSKDAAAAPADTAARAAEAFIEELELLVTGKKKESPK